MYAQVDGSYVFVGLGCNYLDSTPLSRPRRRHLQNNPEKLGTVEDALARYKGREDVLFQRLKKQYGKPVPV